MKTSMEKQRRCAGIFLSNLAMVICGMMLVLFAVGCPQNIAESGSTVTGRSTTFPSGDGVPFIRVLVHGDEDSRFRVTDSNGSYTMFHMPTGEYTANFAWFGMELYSQQLIVNEDDQVYTLNMPELQPGLEPLTGMITDVEGPIEGAAIWVIYPGEGIAKVVSGDNGDYLIENLPDGEVTVIAEAPDYVSQTVEDVKIGFEGVRLLDFELNPVVEPDVGTVLGVVTDEDGEMLVDAYIGAFPAGTDPSIFAIATAEVLSVETGYELASLPVGTYTLVCIRSGYAPESEIVVVDKDGEHTIDFELVSEEDIWRESGTAYGLLHADIPARDSD